MLGANVEAGRGGSFGTTSHYASLTLIKLGTGLRTSRVFVRMQTCQNTSLTIPHTGTVGEYTLDGSSGWSLRVTACNSCYWVVSCVGDSFGRCFHSHRAQFHGLGSVCLCNFLRFVYFLANGIILVILPNTFPQAIPKSNPPRVSE